MERGLSTSHIPYTVHQQMPWAPSISRWIQYLSGHYLPPWSALKNELVKMQFGTWFVLSSSPSHDFLSHSVIKAKILTRSTRPYIIYLALSDFAALALHQPTPFQTHSWNTPSPPASQPLPLLILLAGTPSPRPFLILNLLFLLIAVENSPH